MNIIASVYDSKVQVWSFPQQFVNKGSLARSWEEAANDNQSPFAKYPADFTMFIIGEWDDKTGHIKMYQTPESLGTALMFKNPETTPSFRTAGNPSDSEHATSQLNQ